MSSDNENRIGHLSDEQLLQSAQQLRARLDAIESEARRRNLPEKEEPGTKRERRSTTAIRPIRDVVLDALQDLDSPAYSRQLALYCEAQFGRTIPPPRFGPLANDEIKAFYAGKARKPVCLCFGLTYDRFEPIKRLWCRSDWSIEKRIVAPTTGRVLYLKSTARLAELAAQGAASDPEMLRILAADHARDLGLSFKRGEFPLELWRRTALDMLKELEPEDEALRLDAAAKLARHPEAFQLFGVPEVQDGGLDAFARFGSKGS